MPPRQPWPRPVRAFAIVRVAEVTNQDLDIGEDGGLTYRTKLSVSFKYEDG